MSERSLIIVVKSTQQHHFVSQTIQNRGDEYGFGSSSHFSEPCW
jgi:hypothetical protein